MARHLWSVLCERVLVDAETHGISLIDVAEEVLIEEGLPRDEVLAMPLELALVSSWMRESPQAAERGMTRFSLRAPDGSELVAGVEVAVGLGEERRAQTVTRLEALPLRGPGTYDFVVEYRPENGEQWRECARIPLDVGESEPRTA